MDKTLATAIRNSTQCLHINTTSPFTAIPVDQLLAPGGSSDLSLEEELQIPPFTIPVFLGDI